jgi:hypothetical protein
MRCKSWFRGANQEKVTVATIVERINKKTGLPSYRVQVRHHNRFLKVTGFDKTISKTFHTWAEAEVYASSVEQEFRSKSVKTKEIRGLLEAGPGHRAEIDQVLKELHETRPKETLTLFSHVIKKYEVEIMTHKAYNTRNTRVSKSAFVR